MNDAAMSPHTSAVRPGVRLGIDVGSVRIGVAASDPSGFLASPVETVPRASGDPEPGGPETPDVLRIAEVALERDAVAVVVGLPRSMDGTERAAAGLARAFARRIAAACPQLDVRLVDERLSTVTATRSLRAAGVPGRRQRGVVDQAAAVVFLQEALDVERATGRPAGHPVGDPADA